MDLIFKAKTEYLSQQTIAKFLEKYDFKFIPINEYDNQNFYCILLIECNSEINLFKNRLFNLFGIHSKNEPKYIESPLMLGINNCYQEHDSTPIVFTREEVTKLVRDNPERYKGKSII